MDATRFPLPPPPSRGVKPAATAGERRRILPGGVFLLEVVPGDEATGMEAKRPPSYHVPEHRRMDGFGCWAVRCAGQHGADPCPAAVPVPTAPQNPSGSPRSAPCLLLSTGEQQPLLEMSRALRPPWCPSDPSARPDRVPRGDGGRGHGPGGPGGAGGSSSSGISPVSAAKRVRPPWCLGSGWNECMHIPLPQHVCLLFSSAAVID